MRCQIKRLSQLNPRNHHNSLPTIWQMYSLWSAVDRLLRSSHWSFTRIP